MWILWFISNTSSLLSSFVPTNLQCITGKKILTFTLPKYSKLRLNWQMLSIPNMPLVVIPMCKKSLKIFCIHFFWKTKLFLLVIFLVPRFYHGSAQKWLKIHIQICTFTLYVAVWSYWIENSYIFLYIHRFQILFYSEKN